MEYGVSHQISGVTESAQSWIALCALIAIVLSILIAIAWSVLIALLVIVADLTIACPSPLQLCLAIIGLTIVPTAGIEPLSIVL